VRAVGLEESILLHLIVELSHGFPPGWIKRTMGGNYTQPSGDTIRKAVSFSAGRITLEAGLNQRVARLTDHAKRLVHADHNGIPDHGNC
jgi:hypothetical protein